MSVSDMSDMSEVASNRAPTSCPASAAGGLDLACRRTVAGLVDEVAGVVGSLDPALITASDAAVLVERFARLEALAHTAATLLAARVAETEVWRGRGDPTAAHWLARRMGTTLGTARRTLTTGRRLDVQADLAVAARAGRLSRDTLHDVSSAAAADEGSAATLLDGIGDEAVSEIRDRCSRVRAAAMSDAEKERRARRTTGVRSRAHSDGTTSVTYRDRTELAAGVLAVLDGFRRLVFDADRQAGRRDSFKHRGAEAMRLMAGAAASASSPSDGRSMSGDRDMASAGKAAKPLRIDPKVIVRVDFDSLVRGSTRPGETCEIAGLGPVPVDVVRAMLDDAFLAVVVTRGVDIMSVSHRGRGPDAHQRTALQWAHTSCSVLGCTNRAFIEIDHRLPYREISLTELLNLDPLCSHHHHLKTHKRHRLEPGTGRRRMLGPDEVATEPVHGPPPDEQCDLPPPGALDGAPLAA